MSSFALYIVGMVIVIGGLAWGASMARLATQWIAMGAIGTDVAIETADVVLMSDDIEKVDYVIHLGKRARRVVRQNVYFSIGWMLFLVVIALTVGIPLPLAVVGHEGGTVLVVLNGLRLLRDPIRETGVKQERRSQTSTDPSLSRPARQRTYHRKVARSAS